MATAATADKNGGGQLSLLTFIALLATLTLIAVAAGGYLGLQFYASIEKAAAGKVAKDKEIKINAAYTSPASIVQLPAILTNLAGEPKAWVRLEASVLFEGDQPADAPLLAPKFAADIVAFLRTLTLAQVEGASAFQHLRDDLTERVRVRGGEKARELIIHAMILE